MKDSKSPKSVIIRILCFNEPEHNVAKTISRCQTFLSSCKVLCYHLVMRHIFMLIFVTFLGISNAAGLRCKQPLLFLPLFLLFISLSPSHKHVSVIWPLYIVSEVVTRLKNFPIKLIFPLLLEANNESLPQH